MNIRPVEHADLDALLPLSQQLNQMHAAAYPALYRLIPAEDLKHMLVSRIEAETVLFRLAEAEARPLGYLIAERRETAATAFVLAVRSLYLAELMVAPAARGSGVGTALMADLRDQAREMGIAHLELDVGGFNEPARQFFRHQGFGLLRERLSLDIWGFRAGRSRLRALKGLQMLR